MKIGILTYHRTHNFGGCLQALATRLVLENMGHQVYFVDYWPDYHKQRYSLLSFQSIWTAPTILSGIRAYVESFLCLPYSIKRRKNFMRFLNECIIPFCKPTDDVYDVIIYGSDQIWRKQPLSNDYNPIYFASNEFKAKKHIAFSASMGILPTEVQNIDTVRKLCQNFDKISVRETNLCDFLLGIGFYESCVTLDPTLLVSRTIWDGYVNQEEYQGPQYALFYELNEGVFDMAKVKKFANDRGLLLKVVKGSARKRDTQTEISTAGPYEFITLIKNARYVFSSSFHGLVFAIIYGKEVFVSFKTNVERSKSLLDMAGIPDRFIDPGEDIPDLPPIDYEMVESRIDEYREVSLNYLRKI